MVRANTAECTVNMGKVESLMLDNLRKVDILQFLCNTKGRCIAKDVDGQI